MSEQTVQAVDTVETKPNLSNVALGIGQDVDGKWGVFVYKYNSYTQQVEFSEFLPEGSKGLAEERFRVLAAQKVMA